MFVRIFTAIRQLIKTISSLFGAMRDALILRLPITRKFFNRSDSFAFLVHPRTDDLVGKDVYGTNDIYRPYPAFAWVFIFLPNSLAKKIVLWYAQNINPITLSRIRVGQLNGRLLSTVRTPTLMFGNPRSLRTHMQELYNLAGAWGVQHVGLGALIPSVTKYGSALRRGNLDGPWISTGHAYTGYVIVDYLRTLINTREPKGYVPKVAILGAAGSTGKATARSLNLIPIGNQIELILVDLPEKITQLEELRREILTIEHVRTSINHEELKNCDYVIVVTNGKNAKLSAENVNPGAVLIDDSQPRNTGIELKDSGCHVIDVLARVPGLDCGFDFGFQTKDKSVTFTCLAETVLRSATGINGDFAVGEVTDDLVLATIKMVEEAKKIGLVGKLPWFSFGAEMTQQEQDALLIKQNRLKTKLMPAAE